MKAASLLLLGLAVNAIAAGQSSANFNVLGNSVDGGGLRATSASYSNDGSLGGIGGLVTTRSSQETDRTGYAGQLFEMMAFTLLTPNTNVNEGASIPVYAVQSLDDGTVSPASSFARWSFTGPISSVSASGILTAASVSQSTPAGVSASLEGWSASLNLMVVFTNAFPVGYNRIAAQLMSDGKMQLSFVGSNGMNYALDRSYNVSPPVNWMPQLTNPAGVNGMLVFTNLANPTTNNFWRVRSVP